MGILESIFAVFLLCYGIKLLSYVMEFGHLVAEKSVLNSGKFFKVLLLSALRLVRFITKKIFGKYFRSSDTYVVRPIVDVTPLQLQHLRNQQLFQSRKISPVVIEYTQPKS